MLTLLLVIVGVPVAVFLIIVAVVAILELKKDISVEKNILLRKGLERANEDRPK